MKDTDLLASLEKIFHLECRSFVRYILEAAGPITRFPEDEQARGIIEAWYRETQGNLGTIERLLESEERIPGPSAWSLEFTQYHYLQYSYLLRPLTQRMDALLAAIEAEGNKLESWPAGRDAVRRLLETERSYLKQAEEMESRLERPETEAPRDRRRVSANWW